MDFILGPIFFQFYFQLLPHHASCPDHLTTKNENRRQQKEECMNILLVSII